MTDIEKRALALLNERHSPYEYAPEDHPVRVLARAIEQHEAFRREVSDAVEHFKRCYPGYQHASLFDRFIIPKPVDPLVEVLREVTNDGNPATMAAWQKEADTVRAAMKARGYEWTKIEGAA